MVLNVELTEDELRYLFAMVLDDTDDFVSSPEFDDAHRSRFTDSALDALSDKLNPDNWKLDEEKE